MHFSVQEESLWLIWKVSSRPMWASVSTIISGCWSSILFIAMKMRDPSADSCGSFAMVVARCRRPPMQGGGFGNDSPNNADQEMAGPVDDIE